jgi:hypothetical protein
LFAGKAHRYLQTDHGGGGVVVVQRSVPSLQEGVWDKMMRGLSTRNYGAVVKEFSDAYGIEKSAVSETSSKPAAKR